MSILRLFLCILALSPIFCHADSLLVNNGSLRVYGLNNSEESDIPGCSCGFEYERDGKKYTVAGWLYGADAAIMRINEKPEKFNVRSLINHPKAKEPRKGDRFSYILKNSSYTASITGVVSQTCTGMSDCEAVGYAGKISLSTGGSKVTFPVSGWCGC